MESARCRCALGARPAAGHCAALDGADAAEGNGHVL